MYNKRLYYNLKILFKLLIHFLKYPDTRFFQGLVGTRTNLYVTNPIETQEIYIKDEFYLESKETYERLKI